MHATETIRPASAPTPRSRRFGRRERVRRIVPQRQRSATDCGRTCLAMVLSHHGRATSPEQLAAYLPPTRDGQSALALLEAARAEGLEGQGLSLPHAALAKLAPASILHWRGRHFVVLERCISEREFVIVDPASGRRRISAATMAANFSGIALSFQPAADFEPRARNRARLGPYLRPFLAQRGALALALSLSLGLCALSLVIPLLTTVLVDEVIAAGSERLLGLVALAGAALVVGRSLSTWGRARVLVRLHERFDRAAVLELLERLLALPYAFFQRRSVGDLVMRLGSLAQIRESLTAGALSAFVDGTLVLTYLAVLCMLSPRLAGLAGILALAQVTLFGLAHRRSQALNDAYLGAEAESRGFSTRMLLGVQTLKATGCESQMLGRYAELFEGVLDASRARGQLRAVLDGLGAGLGSLGPLLLLGVGTLEVMGGRMSLGEMLGASQLALSFLAPVAALIGAATRLQLSLSHIERLDEIHTREPEPSGTDSVSSPLRGGLSLRGVGFRYGPRGPWALQDVDLEVAPGQRVAIVGASGSGKSTLARVMLGLSRAQQGEVCFDGHPLGEFDLHELRQQLGVVEQEARLFDMSVEENISLGSPEASPEDIERAARLAHIDGEISRLPMGYATRLSDGGSALSGGQRQRLALARALVRQPRLLLLDEATSALDAISEAAIQRAVAKLECTVITIAHRLSTVRDADLIVVMDGGRVVETGNHAQLSAAGGRYSELIDAQLG